MPEIEPISIPSSLRTIQPFLDDAQKFYRHANRYPDGATYAKYAKISISCINLAFKVSQRSALLPCLFFPH
eukprot:scaffold1193_cov159-Ochromonas_danica.AAC.9